MCDTLVAVGSATADGTVILAKNSDREPNEAHMLVHLPRAYHEPGSTVKCTYVEIPQVPETYEVLLCKPFWIWGCEMGVNEHGVAIGNEAVFTRDPYHKGPGLIGMDFIRLALERAETAQQALEIIIQLLETYGQGGNCGFRHKTYYHNSFIIADPQEAWVLETSGKQWAAEQVRDVRSISNGLTIGSRWDRASSNLVEHALEKGWAKSREDFHFARCYSDFLYTRLDGCQARYSRSMELLEKQKGAITVETMMAALRDHGPKAEKDPLWNPGRGWLMDTICVHAGFGPTRPSQSVGAMVAHLTPGMPVVWVTGTSGICTSIFKPIFLGAGLPGGAVADKLGLSIPPSGTYDPRTLWWTHERLHRAVIRDFPTRMALYREERDALEREFIKEATELQAHYRDADPEIRKKHLLEFTTSCFERAAEATARWIQRVLATPIKHRPPRLFSLAWERFNREARFPSEEAYKA
ncbi:MAG: C69 family dipeptidase [Anaerolineae bacterium]|nr:C69 family dipeptidase [Anaerolineae bacterium]MDW8101273.1 C69 family dipeptidase [Anaerolineae bacterium]